MEKNEKIRYNDDNDSQFIYKENVGWVPKVEPGEYEAYEGVYQD